LNSKIWKQIYFEPCLNFKGVQTFRQKSHQSPKIQHWHVLQEYEFILAHLHLKIWSSFTNDKYDLVYKNQTIQDLNSKKKIEVGDSR
jgi:hypothetical protein